MLHYVLGYAMMTEIDIDKKSEKVLKTLGVRSLGAGLFTLGFYLWSPASLRAMWMNTDKK